MNPVIIYTCRVPCPGDIPFVGSFRSIAPQSARVIGGIELGIVLVVPVCIPHARLAYLGSSQS